MQQNTSDWHAWRNSGLGASDAPIIMGASEYKTPFQLYEEKALGKTEKEKSSFVASLGHKFEPAARADLFFSYGFEFKPTCAEHQDTPWLRASLDGLNEEHQLFAEIKYIGLEKYQKLKSENYICLPHWIQMQHQFIVTGYKKAIYICYTLNEDKNDIKEIHHIEIEPDISYIQDTLFPKLKEFWNMVQTKTPPPMTKKDVKRLSKKSN